jgi:hypothetical protein
VEFQTIVNSVNELPAPWRLKRLFQAMAMLDAILSNKLGEPVYSFSDKWTAKQSVGAVNNGQGDDLFFVFEAERCFWKGSAHDASSFFGTDCQMRLRGLVPKDCLLYLKEPAFECDNATVFGWNGIDGSEWHSTTEKIAGVDDGSAYLLSFIKLVPVAFWQWAVDNYEVDLSLELVERVYDHVPLTDNLLFALDPGLNADIVRCDAIKIGYPLAK